MWACPFALLLLIFVTPLNRAFQHFLEVLVRVIGCVPKLIKLGFGIVTDNYLVAGLPLEFFHADDFKMFGELLLRNAITGNANAKSDVQEILYVIFAASDNGNGCIVCILYRIDIADFVAFLKRLNQSHSGSFC